MKTGRVTTDLGECAAGSAAHAMAWARELVTAGMGFAEADELAAQGVVPGATPLLIDWAREHRRRGGDQ